ncbi:MAG: hypothetical protein KDK78_06505 [Chlamydiia bacterium]|nr:hypothetical protein [Chlamydiia bacterium]
MSTSFLLVKGAAEVEINPLFMTPKAKEPNGRARLKRSASEGQLASRVFNEDAFLIPETQYTKRRHSWQLRRRVKSLPPYAVWMEMRQGQTTQDYLKGALRPFLDSSLHEEYCDAVDAAVQTALRKEAPLRKEIQELHDLHSRISHELKTIIFNSAGDLQAHTYRSDPLSRELQDFARRHRKELKRLISDQKVYDASLLQLHCALQAEDGLDRNKLTRWAIDAYLMAKLQTQQLRAEAEYPSQRLCSWIPKVDAGLDASDIAKRDRSLALHLHSCATDLQRAEVFLEGLSNGKIRHCVARQVHAQTRAWLLAMDGFSRSAAKHVGEDERKQLARLKKEVLRIDSLTAPHSSPEDLI